MMAVGTTALSRFTSFKPVIFFKYPSSRKKRKGSTELVRDDRKGGVISAYKTKALCTGASSATMWKKYLPVLYKSTCFFHKYIVSKQNI